MFFRMESVMFSSILKSLFYFRMHLVLLITHLTLLPSFLFCEPSKCASDCRRKMEQWRPMTSEPASSLWVMTWYVFQMGMGVFSLVPYTCILQSAHTPSMWLSGGGGVCPYNDPGGPQWYWERLLPVFH